MLKKTKKSGCLKKYGKYEKYKIHPPPWYKPTPPPLYQQPVIFVLWPGGGWSLDIETWGGWSFERWILTKCLMVSSDQVVGRLKWNPNGSRIGGGFGTPKKLIFRHCAPIFFIFGQIFAKKMPKIFLWPIWGGFPGGRGWEWARLWSSFGR